ncbi:glutamate--cysteine ligase [Catenovulum sediminis]|uniref:Glutamate--cysteine ligase n=1 Tax=Catenovulum sediminis TaxID=1740262 RepID=A0ABV1RER4_9ALTE|nr:glutamate--cysteine ligase [Catenovulum sediminis]
MILAGDLRDFFETQGTAYAGQLSRGIEKEALRIAANGKLAKTSHPAALGSALTNPYITTDYAESLLEFITPVENKPEVSLSQLADLHKFAYHNQQDELLWPMSMPCFVGCESDIEIAQYGSSNTGKMKTLYREGLKNRYGSYMQVIAGVHFNFSFPHSFWQRLAKQQNKTLNQDFISDRYLAVLRNVKRHLWLLAYLFGASPALCSSFIEGKQSAYPFEKVGKGSLYLPYATSLRLSDLGYTNKAQSVLSIRYNNLDEYIAGLRQAIKMPSGDFAHIPSGQNGIFNQLNSNVLQIENEYYSPVRPKRVTKSGEKPTDALARDGIQYIELRALDINPFTPVGLDIEQIRFLDVFLTWCAIQASPEIHCNDEFLITANMQQTILYGRKPGVELNNGQQKITLTEWAHSILDDLYQLANYFDGDASSNYRQALDCQMRKIRQPETTPSGRVISRLLSENIDNGELGLQLASQYRSQLMGQDYAMFDAGFLADAAKASREKQVQIEQSQNLPFDVFLNQYFAQ